MVFFIGPCSFFLPGCFNQPLSGGFSHVDSFKTFKIDGYGNALYQKAITLDALIQARHLTREGLLAYAIRINPSYDEKYDVLGFGDMTIWSGCYVAAQAFRYAVMGDQESLEQIMKTVKGLSLLQRVTGKRGLLARGVKKSQRENPVDGEEWNRGKGEYSSYQWLGDVSIDQMNGVIFGLAVVFDLIDNPPLRKSIALQVRNIADHLIDHEMTIEDIDGKRTKHGDLTDGLFSEPLNALIALALFKAAYKITGDDFYQRHYLTLIKNRGYHKKAIKARDPWWEVWTGTNHSDNNLAFLAYYILLRFEKDPSLLKFYVESLNRAWENVKKENNPHFTFIYHAIHPQNIKTQSFLSAAVETLYLFPTDRRNHEVVNSDRSDLCMAWRKDRFGRKQACIPLPMDQRPADDFEWKENPYRLDGGGAGDVEFSGVDYLLPYWMGRYYGFITEEM